MGGDPRFQPKNVPPPTVSGSPPPPPPRAASPQPDIKHIQAIDLRPGDTLILAFKNPLSDKAYADLKRRIDEAMPGLAHVIVLEDAAAVAAYRPGQG